MKYLIVPVCALIVLVAAIAWHWNHYMPLLPDRVAIHMNGSGVVDRWTDKASFETGTLSFLVGMPLLVLGLGTVATLAICFCPPYLVNTPRKDYWLASPENRQLAALLTVRFFLWFLFGILTMIYFGVIQALVLATISPEVNSFSSSVLVFGIGLLFVFAQVGYLLYCLYHPTEPIPQ